MKTKNFKKTSGIHQQIHPNDQMPIHRLIGKIDENFYQLGLMDGEQFCGEKKAIDLFLEELDSAIFPRKIALSESLKLSLKALILHPKNLHLRNLKILKAYSEGLKKPYHELLYYTLLPEVMNSLGRLTQHLPTPNWGCTSVFSYEKDQLQHFRVLDFPINETFTRWERGLLCEFDQSPKFFGVNCLGIPYPTYTAMSEKGITCAVHQKFSLEFETSGTPIPELLFNLFSILQKPTDVQDFFQETRPMTTWGLFFAFDDLGVLEVEVSPKNYQEKFYSIDDIKKSPIIFNNLPMNRSRSENENSKVFPKDIFKYHECRMENSQRKIQRFLKDVQVKKSYEHNSLNGLKNTLATPLSSKIHQAEIDLLTPSSVQITNFSTKDRSSQILRGPAPKVFVKEWSAIENPFHLKNFQDLPKQILYEEKIPMKFSKTFQTFLFHLHRAQKYSNLNETRKIYHHLQMAFALLKNSNDLSHYLGPVKFFFLVTQFFHEHHEVTSNYIKTELLDPSLMLPEYLNHNRDKIVQSLISFNEMPLAKRIVHFEALKRTTILRYDLFNIIFL